MIIRILLVLLMVVNIFGCAHWDRTDKILFAAFTAATIADVATTDRGLDNGGEEKNPLFKNNTGLILPLNILGLGAIYLISDHLTPKGRKWLLGIGNGIKWGCVIHNAGEMNK